MWAWMLELPLSPVGVQSLPRELELPEDGVLRIKPLRELASLRYEPKQEKINLLKSDAVLPLKEIHGNTLELQLTFKAPSAKEVGLWVLCDASGANGVDIAYLSDTRILKVGRVSAPFELKPGEDLTLRVFIDKNFVEVFANDRQAAATAIAYNKDNLGISLFSKGAVTAVKSVQSWKMKSAYSTK